MMVFFDEELRPELLALLPLPLTLGVEVEVILAVVVNGTTELVVTTEENVRLPLTTWSVVTTATVRLDVSLDVMTEVTG